MYLHTDANVEKRVGNKTDETCGDSRLEQAFAHNMMIVLFANIATWNARQGVDVHAAKWTHLRMLQFHLGVSRLDRIKWIDILDELIELYGWIVRMDGLNELSGWIGLDERMKQI